MARSDVDHFKLLNRWPVTMMENEYHFNQIAGEGAPLTKPCDTPYIQRERDYIANALNQAVEMVARELGFYPRPVWLNERLHLGRGVPFELQPLQLSYGHVQTFGIRTTSLIEAGVSVTYSDANSDAVLDTATITVTTAVAVGEVGVFFQVADGAESAGHVNWEIEPLTLTASGGVVTITGPRHLFVKPSQVWAKEYTEPNYTDKNSGSTQTVSDFVLAVDIYRVYGATGSDLLLNTDPIFCNACGSGLGTYNTEAATGLIWDSRLGIVKVRATDCCSACGYWPEHIDIFYQAGLALENGKMNRLLETAIIRLANTLMPQQPNTFCDRSMNMWQYDQEEIETTFLTQTDMHPFGGTFRGRIEAWRNIKHMKLGEGGKVTARWR